MSDEVIQAQLTQFSVLFHSRNRNSKSKCQNYGKQRELFSKQDFNTLQVHWNHVQEVTADCQMGLVDELAKIFASLPL